MSDKVRIKMTAVLTVEFEADPKNYNVTDRSPERMLAIELENADDDAIGYFDNSETEWKITGEILR